jgi:predicted ABC-type ATPase
MRSKLLTRTSFGLETVFSDSSGLKLDLLREARQSGYRVGVIFIGLDDPQLSIARVMDRVDNGGHDVPDELIRERFPRSFQNLKKAIPLADFVLLVDNSRETRHRVFGTIIREKGVHLWDIVPRWYEEFGIGR